MLCMCQGLSPKYQCLADDFYAMVFPGSEIPEWFSHQCMGDKVNIMEPFSPLCNDWIGIVVCVVFCSLPRHQTERHYQVDCILTVNGKDFESGTGKMLALSDHSFLFYMLPQFCRGEDRKSLWECDANGFCEIGIKFDNEEPSLVKKCKLRVVYRKDIEDLNHTVVQCSNNSIIPYEGLKESMVNIVRSQVSTRNVVKS